MFYDTINLLELGLFLWGTEDIVVSNEIVLLVVRISRLCQGSEVPLQF